MELNQSCSNTSICVKKSTESLFPSQALNISISLLVILLIGIVIFRLFKSRNLLGAIVWLLIHYFVISLLREFFLLLGISSKVKPVSDNILGCVIGFIWLFWFRSSEVSNLAVICFYIWFHSRKIINRTVSARSLPGVLLCICLTWILSLGQTSLLLNTKSIGTDQSCRMVTVVKLWAQIIFLCVSFAILSLGLLVGLYTWRTVTIKLRSFTVHRARFRLYVQRELKRYGKVIKLILPAIIIRGVTYLLGIISFIFITYVGSGSKPVGDIDLINMNTVVLLPMSLWILWRLSRINHQEIITDIDLTNNPDAAADLHNKEIERTWNVRPKSPK